MKRQVFPVFFAASCKNLHILNDDMIWQERGDEMEVYITKFALSKGLIKGTVVANYIAEDAYTRKKENRYTIETQLGTFSLLREDFEHDREKAIQRAEKMRNEEISNLQKRVQELYRMSFR